MYLDFNFVLPFQRPFTFINGVREIGKTYTTLKYLFKKCLENNESFVYICRTQKEKQLGILEHATAKVRENEFPEVDFKINSFTISTENGIVAYCIALSEYQEIKKYSFPNCFYLIFDEYMLDYNTQSKYITGYNEPELLMNIYHTIDRGHNKLKCYLLGNNTFYNNPYHLYKPFSIPLIKEGEYYKNKICLYWRPKPDKDLAEKLNTDLNKSILSTEYGRSHFSGEFFDESFEFPLIQLSAKSHLLFSLTYKTRYYIYTDYEQGAIIVSKKGDKNIRNYNLLLEDGSINRLLLVGKVREIEWLANVYKKGLLYYESKDLYFAFRDIFGLIIRG